MEDRPALLEDFGAFYRAHLDVVLTFCLARVRDRELAADLAAEVFAAALIGRGRYRSDRGTERQWLLGIAANKIADARRRGVAERRAQQRLGMAAIEWSEEDYERVASLADGSAVVRLMEALPIEQQVVIWGHVVDEQTYGQLADAYGVKSATVRKTRQPRLGDAARPGGEGGPMTSGFDQLERELRAAEARLAAQHVTPRGMRSPAGLLRAGTALVSALIAIGVVVAAFTVLHPGNRSTGQISPAGPGKRYRDPEGWSVTYPHGLHLTVAKGTAALQEPQVTLTSFTASRFLQGRLRNGTALIPGQMSFNAPVDGDGRFPADGVAVILQSGQYTVLGADSRFPIALSSFHPRSTTTFLATADSRRADVPRRGHG